MRQSRSDTTGTVVVLVALAAGLAMAMVTASCTRRQSAPDWPVEETPVHPLAGYEAHFWLTWNGSRIGDASESLRRRTTRDSGGGLKFERRERISVRRGDALVHSETAIAVYTDAELAAHEITVWQISNESEIRGRAQRDSAGRWIAQYGDEAPRELDRDAVPAELVPLLIAARRVEGRPGGLDGLENHGPKNQSGDPTAVFDGPAIRAGYGFATARLVVTAPDARTLVATWHTPHGAIDGRFALTGNGTVARVIVADGIGAIRVDKRERAMAFDPPELVDSSSLPVITNRGYEGDGPSGDGDRISLIIAPLSRAAPPALPGQHVTAGRDNWYVRLYDGDTAPVATAPGDSSLATSPSPGNPVAIDPGIRQLADQIVAESKARNRHGEIVALVEAIAELIEDDLGAEPSGARNALALGRGDCTAHAMLFVELARARGIAARLVTGYRVDGERLVRHRWAIVASKSRWIAVDPTYGEAPASPRLLGLAVHDGSFAEMAVADELAFAGFARAQAYWTP